MFKKINDFIYEIVFLLSFIFVLIVIVFFLDSVL